MDFLADIELSFSTLLAALFVPFIFFGYRAKFRFNEVFASRGDWLFSIVVGALLVALVLRLARVDAESLNDQVQFSLLHALPLIQSLFMVFFVRGGGGQGVGDAVSAALSGVNLAGVGQAPAAANDERQPLNDQIEQISWADLIIPEDLRQELTSIIELLQNPDAAEQYGIEVPKGILFNGPPGTGKTTIAKVVANEAGLSFFTLKLDEIVSKWVGESEKNLSALFDAAMKNAPAVLFIDEIDAIGKQRSGAGGQEHREGFLNHLLQLMDGVIKTKGLYIIAATNRADLVDSALKRPGRLNKVIEIGLPDAPARKRLFDLYLAKLHLEQSVNVEALVDVTEGKSPAVIREVCNQAGLNAFKRESGTGKRTGKVTRDDIQKAIADFL